jgi:hypothetical protein
MGAQSMPATEVGRVYVNFTIAITIEATRHATSTTRL